MLNIEGEKTPVPGYGRVGQCLRPEEFEGFVSGHKALRFRPEARWTNVSGHKALRFRPEARWAGRPRPSTVHPYI